MMATTSLALRTILSMNNVKLWNAPSLATNMIKMQFKHRIFHTAASISVQGMNLAVFLILGFRSRELLHLSSICVSASALRLESVSASRIVSVSSADEETLVRASQ